MSRERQGDIDPLPRTEQLLSEAAGGDHASFSVLYAVTSPSIYGLIRKVLIDVRQSDLVTQQVFLEVWKRAARYDPAASSATSWMLTIAHECAVDHAREPSQGAAVPEMEIAREREDLDSSASGIRIQMEHARARQALAQLTPHQRRALTLAFWDALTIDEIADTLGVSPATAHARLLGGLRRLRSVFDNETLRA